MFFGTRANVYFLACASVSWLMARIAITATVAPSSFLSIFSPPLLGEGVGLTRVSVPPTAADPVKEDRENDDDADEEPLPVAVHAGHQQAVADQFDQRRTDERPERSTFAAEQIGAADDRRSDRPQFVV